MPIWTLNELDDSGGVFKGRAGDPFEWSSKLPEENVFGRFATDPAFRDDLLGSVPHLAEGGWTSPNLVGRLAMYNVASALRINIGRIATTLGFLSTQIPAVRSTYYEPLEAVARAVDLAKKVVNSKQFQNALNALGFIPIVGWIIKILARVAETVIRIVDAVRDKREAKARRALAKVASIPLAQYMQGADEVLTKAMMLRIADFDAQWVVEPRYPAASGSDFVALQEEVDPGDDLWAGWLVYTERNAVGLDPQSAGAGLGYVPGTRNLHASIELRTGYGGSVRDLGEFYPTVRMAAVQFWEMLVNDGPAMFGVDTERAKAKWEDYAASAHEFGSEILGGWSMSRTALEMGATQHLCVPEIYGIGDCKGSKRGKLVGIPGNGHRSAWLSYMRELFDPREVHNEGQPWTTDNIDWSSIATTRALDNLKERQISKLQSIECMYVDDGLDERTGLPRYRAIGTQSSKGPLWNRWYQSVKSVFESGDWKRVRFRDVPEGRLKQELREWCAGQSVDCDSLGTVGGFQIAGPSSLGDPVPPDPPDPREVSFGDFEVAPPKKRKRKSSPAEAAAGLALLGGGAWALSKVL